jgi:hypothetical protein
VEHPESLRGLSASADASWYAIEGEHQSSVERYVLSTAPSREICNRPELVGVEYTTALEQAMASGLREAPFRSLIADHPQEQVCVVHFLRGGLNFGLRGALHQAYGMNRHCSAFMSSQRFRVDGRWDVKENMYRKLAIPRDAVLVMGDVVATGVTMGAGLDVILEHVREIGSSVRGLVLFTIGCHKAEKLLESLDAKMREAFPEYTRTVLVYVEGKFRLVDSKTPLRIAVQGTDLVRLDALLAPELALSQFEAPAHALERCAIYDAGSRAFDLPTYRDDVLEYWTEVEKLADEGLSLEEAILERWPDARHESRTHFVDAHAPRWKNVDPALMDRVFAAQEAFWSGMGERGAGALKALAGRRLATLREA